MYLADTNLIAEILLRQTKAGEVKRFLENTAPEGLYLTEFSLYSLGIILLRRKMHDYFLADGGRSVVDRWDSAGAAWIGGYARRRSRIPEVQPGL